MPSHFLMNVVVYLYYFMLLLLNNISLLAYLNVFTLIITLHFEFYVLVEY